mmetsp:Transcript_1894/g.5536  ORF Transcript_1894/g.5536 Transcript_1894/m.5536 type:complete len:211 (-) Transcript_1894:806-1438(-)
MRMRFDFWVGGLVARLRARRLPQRHFDGPLLACGLRPAAFVYLRRVELPPPPQQLPQRPQSRRSARPEGHLGRHSARSIAHVVGFVSGDYLRRIGRLRHARRKRRRRDSDPVHHLGQPSRRRREPAGVGVRLDGHARLGLLGGRAAGEPAAPAAPHTGAHRAHPGVIVRNPPGGGGARLQNRWPVLGTCAAAGHYDPLHLVAGNEGDKVD